MTTTEHDAAVERNNLIGLLRREGTYSGVWFAEHLLRAADTIAALATTPPRDGYAEAFYEIATMLGIGARTASPQEVWDNEMRPKLAALVAPPREDSGEVVRLREALEPFAGLRLSTEGEVSDLVYRSPAEEMRRHAEMIDRRDSDILRARATLEPQAGDV